MNIHFVGVYRLNPEDLEYSIQDERGRHPRAVIEQVDGDRFYFPSINDGYEFLAIHGMKAVSDEDLQKLRAEERL